jgi:hypothetical protein
MAPAPSQNVKRTDVSLHRCCGLQLCVFVISSSFKKAARFARSSRPLGQSDASSKPTVSRTNALAVSGGPVENEWQDAGNGTFTIDFVDTINFVSHTGSQEGTIEGHISLKK